MLGAHKPFFLRSSGPTGETGMLQTLARDFSALPWMSLPDEAVGLHDLRRHRHSSLRAHLEAAIKDAKLQSVCLVWTNDAFTMDQSLVAVAVEFEFVSSSGTVEELSRNLAVAQACQARRSVMPAWDSLPSP